MKISTQSVALSLSKCPQRTQSGIKEQYEVLTPYAYGTAVTKVSQSKKGPLSFFQQKDLANAVGVNLRTLQDWKMGRSPTPRPVEILMNSMKKNPAVKKELMAESTG